MSILPSGRRLPAPVLGTVWVLCSFKNIIKDSNHVFRKITGWAFSCMHIRTCYHKSVGILSNAGVLGSGPHYDYLQLLGSVSLQKTSGLKGHIWNHSTQLNKMDSCEVIPASLLLFWKNALFFFLNFKDRVITTCRVSWLTNVENKSE